MTRVQRRENEKNRRAKRRQQIVRDVFYILGIVTMIVGGLVMCITAITEPLPDAPMIVSYRHVLVFFVGLLVLCIGKIFKRISCR